MSVVISSSSKISGVIKPPSSKSHSIRSLLFASLAKGTSTITGLLNSPDILAMENACRLIGAQITRTENNCEVVGVDGEPRVISSNVDVANSGQVLRFMTAIFSLQNKEVTLQGDASVNLRPMQPLIDAINSLGGSCCSDQNNGLAPIRVRGIISGGNISVMGVDSQHISALLMSLPFAKHRTTLEVLSPGEKPWIDLTVSWLDRLGIKYTREEYKKFELFGNSRIKSFNYNVPADFSSMAFPLVAALITSSSLTIKNLDFSDRQGDKIVIDICRKMGAKIISTGDTLKIFPSKLHGITIDLNECIDAVPVMCVLAANAVGETRLENIKVARTKECDRLHIMTEELGKMGVKIDEGEDHLVIKHSRLHGNRVSSSYDHRVAMALIVAGFSVDVEGVETTVSQTECIEKSYPGFLDDMQSIGCRVG